MSTSNSRAELATTELFVRFAEALPDAMLLVGSSGRIFGGNAAARSQFGGLPGHLRDLVSGDSTDALRMMSRSRSPLASAMTMRVAGGDLVPFRCDGGLVHARDGASEPLISMRFRARDVASSRFIELNSKVEALAREIRTRRRAEALLRAHAETLEMITSDTPLATVLDRLVRAVEHDTPEPVFASILLYEAATNRLRHGAAPSLPTQYSEAIDGVAAGPEAGSCGTAAFRRERVVVRDIDSDPLWRNFRELAREHGLRACWSEPIMSYTGEVLGTFAVYRTAPGVPSERELETVAMLTRTASIAIERSIADTTRAELHERERAARAEAESANRAKDEFLATVSHELRTPLTAILGWSNLLDDHRADPETREAVRAIASSARAQAQIIEDLLDFSRIAADRMQIQRGVVDIAEVIQQAVSTVRPPADAAGVTLDVQLAPMRGVVEGDPDRLRQIIWNLLTNAIKFAPGGRVTVALSSSEDGVLIDVTDDGEGIPAAFLPRVFERFSQADSTSQRRHGGLGLGLSIVHRLVELHGGTITAASEGPRKGARFTVRLPYARSVVGDGDEQPPREVRSRDTSPLAGLRLLLVEDEASSLEAFRRILKRAGADVVPASSADEALAACQRTRPDVIVSDIGLPGTDGYELLRRIRGGSTAARTAPAIALTAYAQSIDAERSLAAGFDVHMSKPVAPDQLILTVLRLARGIAARAAEPDRAARLPIEQSRPESVIMKSFDTGEGAPAEGGFPGERRPA